MTICRCVFFKSYILVFLSACSMKTQYSHGAYQDAIQKCRQIYYSNYKLQESDLSKNNRAEVLIDSGESSSFGVILSTDENRFEEKGIYTLDGLPQPICIYDSTSMKLHIASLRSGGRYFDSNLYNLDSKGKLILRSLAPKNIAPEERLSILTFYHKKAIFRLKQSGKHKCWIFVGELWSEEKE